MTSVGALFKNRVGTVGAVVQRVRVLSQGSVATVPTIAVGACSGGGVGFLFAGVVTGGEFRCVTTR